MDASKGVTYSDRLRRRREQIEVTLRHIECERREVDENTDWLDQAAYESRVALLNGLTGWYLKEITQIDRALERVRQSRYGLCLACHEPIEADRLEVYPEAEFCSECQEYRERLKTG